MSKDKKALRKELKAKLYRARLDYLWVKAAWDDEKHSLHKVTAWPSVEKALANYDEAYRIFRLCKK